MAGTKQTPASKLHWNDVGENGVNLISLKSAIETLPKLKIDPAGSFWRNKYWTRKTKR
jgi:hypothetical protein